MASTRTDTGTVRIIVDASGPSGCEVAQPKTVIYSGISAIKIVICSGISAEDSE